MVKCCDTTQREPAHLVARDPGGRRRNVSYRIIGYRHSGDVVEAGCDASGGDGGSGGMQGQECNASLSFAARGTYIVSVFADGQEIDASPLLLEVIPAVCTDGRVAGDEDGLCVCASGTVEVVGSCVRYDVLSPAVVVPSVLLLAAVAFAFMHYRLTEERVQWRISEREIDFADPEEVLGVGSQGVVVKAYYRGTPVAVKRFRLGRRVASSSDSKRSPSAPGIARRGSVSLLPWTDDAPAPAPSAMAVLSIATAPVAGREPSVTTTERSGGGGRWSVGTQDAMELSMSTLSEEERQETTLSLLRGSLRGRQTYKRLKRDMVALVAVRHPCITALMGVAEISRGERHGLCLVMELVEFGSLWDLLHNPTFPLRAEAALRILRDVAQGMRFLHEAQPPILHGDLKSANVLVDRSFGARLSDFGLYARRAPIGTPLWRAPECLAGGGISSAADVWSFGVVMYEVLTRRAPYDGQSIGATLAAVARGECRPRAPLGCSAEVAALLSDCVRADPSLRPPFAELDRRLTSLGPELMTSPVFETDEDIPNGVSGSASGDCGGRERAGHLPDHVMRALAAGERLPPESKPMVSMFFSDVAGFTALSSELPAEKVSGMLDRLFDQLDRAAERLGVYKVETIGDAYLCATNVVQDQSDSHAALLARFAVAAVRAASRTLIDEDDPERGHVRFRVGLHSGPCMACVVGRLHPKYTLLGDTVNVASRMESTSLPGRIQCSARTAELICAQDPLLLVEPRGGVEVKGKGTMDTFWVLAEGVEELDVEAEPTPPPPAPAPSSPLPRFSQMGTGSLSATLPRGPPAAVLPLDKGPNSLRSGLPPRWMTNSETWFTKAAC